MNITIDISDNEAEIITYKDETDERVDYRECATMSDSDIAQLKKFLYNLKLKKV